MHGWPRKQVVEALTVAALGLLGWGPGGLLGEIETWLLGNPSFQVAPWMDGKAHGTDLSLELSATQPGARNPETHGVQHMANPNFNSNIQLQEQLPEPQTPLPSVSQGNS